MAKGIVKWFNRTKGYGFVEPEDKANDVFVHITAVQNSGLITLFQGQVISYDLQNLNEDRIAAVNILILVDISDALKSGKVFKDT